MLLLHKNRMPHDKNIYLTQAEGSRDGDKRRKCDSNCRIEQGPIPDLKDVYLASAGCCKRWGKRRGEKGQTHDRF